MRLMGKCPEWGHPQLREWKVESGKPVADSYPTNVHVVHNVHNIHNVHRPASGKPEWG